jgi:hypothetical protein
MTAQVGSHLDSFEGHFERLQGQVSHLDHEPSSARGGSLLKGNTASQRGFKCAAYAAFDVICHERLEQTVDFFADCAANAKVGPLVQVGCAVVSIEEIDAKI